MVDYHPVLQATSCQNHVLVRAPALQRNLTEDVCVVALGNPSSEVDIMRPKILGNAHVGNPSGKRALTSGGDLIDLPNFPCCEALTQLLQRRVEPLDMADRPH